MNKATIIEDAITYIQELQKTSQVLSEQLLEMEGSSEEGGKPLRIEVDAAENMKKCGIKVVHPFFFMSHTLYLFLSPIRSFSLISITLRYSIVMFI